MKILIIVFLFLFFTPYIYSETENSGSPEEGTIRFVVDEELFSESYLERQKLHYESIVKEYLEEIQTLVRRNIEERRRAIERKYEPVIARELEKEAQSRSDAIVLFEEFIRRYPDNEKYTPGAMYRLAELYYERSVIEQERRMVAYEDAIAALERGEITKEPEIPVIDFSPTIKLYRTILETFQDFKYMGAVYYMLGYCLHESGEPEKAVKVWLELMEKGIETPYIAELNLRVGEFYFDNNQLPEAEKYFEKGVKYTDSELFDKILYKLAWTYYRQNFFEKAVETFTELIMFADDMSSKGIDRGQDLRPESIQYIAISFADEEWGSVDKAIEYFSTIDGSNFEKDVFEQLGKYYGENSYYSEAEKAYRFILNKYPNYENAPRIHNSMIRLMYQAREFDRASRETAIFAQMYDQDSEWVRVNRGNATVVQEANEWAREALLNTAAFHHRQAQAFRERGDEERAVEEYRAAAAAYGDYLVKFPYTADSYDITFSFADTLFYSGEIEKAVVVYERIRDDQHQDKNREDAAYQTFVCYNILWQQSEDSKIKGTEKRGTPFSLLERKLIESGDIYFQVARESIEGKPAIAYNAARIFFDHGEFAEAERRYLSIINEFPQHEISILAARDIIASYTEREDWVGVARWSKILSERLSPTETESRVVEQEFTTYRAGALFMYAQKLEEEKKYREAAAEYLRIVEENPYNENADKALSNAAINYQRAMMFDSALQLHERIYKEYPYSELAPQSLFLVGSTAERSFDFEKAVDAYKLLYEKYPAYQRRNDAIYNAGFLLERLKRYREAATFYRLFYNEAKETPEGKEALYLAGTMYWKAEDWRAMIKSSQNFIDTFSNDPEVAHLVMRSYYNIAKVYEEKLNNWNQAKRVYQQIVDYYENNEVKSEEAILYVAEAQFKLIEDDFNAYVKLKVGGRNEKALEESFMRKRDSIAPLIERYTNIMTRYPAAEWVLASMYRIGYILQNFASTLMNSEPPPGMGFEEEEIYFAMLEEQIAGFEDQAVDYYSRGLERARELRVFNRWTQLMTDRLSSLRSAEFSFGKIPIYAADKEFDSGFPLLLSLNRVEKAEYQRAGLAEEIDAEVEKDKAPPEGENE